MSQTVSLGTMLQQVHNLLDTKDLTDWEAGFVKSIWDRAQGQTNRLTDKQVEQLERIWSKHFAG